MHSDAKNSDPKTTISFRAGLMTLTLIDGIRGHYKEKMNLSMTRTGAIETAVAEYASQLGILKHVKLKDPDRTRRAK